jgi:hypothetical protein
LDDDIWLWSSKLRRTNGIGPLVVSFI